MKKKTPLLLMLFLVFSLLSAPVSAAKIPYCIDSTIAWKKVDGIKVAFLGFNCLNGVSYSTVKKTIKKARDKDTMIFQQTFYVNSKTKKLTTKTSAKVIPCSISSVSYTNNYQPTILKGSEKNRDSLPKVSLFTRLRRFGKTLNMDMLRAVPILSGSFPQEFIRAVFYLIFGIVYICYRTYNKYI